MKALSSGRAPALPPAAVLTNGSYSVLVRATGSGQSSLDHCALTAWRGDLVEDTDGFFIYLKDLDDSLHWSAGARPCGFPDNGSYTARWQPGHFSIERDDLAMASRLEIAVDPDRPIELRRLHIENQSGRRRRVEVTSYAEIVLQDRDAFLAHPSFSRLFVQTEWDERRQVLLARRRPRGEGETHPWLFHGIPGGSRVEYETDRARFLGRGRTKAHPAALEPDARLSRTVGNVLDPIVSLRTVVELEPGGCHTLDFVMGAAPDRDLALELASTCGQPSYGDQLLERAATRGMPAESAFDEADAPRFLEVDESRGGDHVGKMPTRFEPGFPAAVVPAGSSEAAVPSAPSPTRRRDDVLFWNGIGGFSQDGRHYEMEIDPQARPPHLPPRPWINVIAGETFGFLVSDTGAGCTWSGNSREHRLTPWYNDPVLDPHGDAFYVKDEETGQFHSLLPGPAPAGRYRVRHGFGVSSFSCRTADLEHEVETFVPGEDSLRLTRVTLTNRTDRARRLSFVAFYRLVLGDLAEVSGRFVVTSSTPGSPRMFARNDRASANAVTFASIASSVPPLRVSVTGDRARFIGKSGSLAAPAALLQPGPLDGSTGAGFDACIAQEALFQIPAGGSVEIAFLFGEAADGALAERLLERYEAPAAATKALELVRKDWNRLLSGFRVETPSPELDLMLNGWIPYQTLACRLRARTAFYQSGGAFGFRDQLQDAVSLIPLDPSIARRQILLHARHQFVEGDVLHWWHPPHSRGIRTRFADDLLWLPGLTATYVKATGDSAILEERLPFLRARALAPGEDEAYLEPEASGTEGDLYEHCVRALDRSLATGAHGLPLFGTGDWNDGMNRVGRLGRGESVWMGFFLHRVLGDFLPICRAREDEERVRRYEEHRVKLATALNDGGWDGAWYRRGYYDDGAPLGSRESDECRIDALAQAWAVLSGVAPPERAESAMAAVERELISMGDGIIRLLKPPFENSEHDPGYIKGYVAGVRENGGQYTHAALWVVEAFGVMKRSDRVAALLSMLNPIGHSTRPEDLARYQTEPYVIAADVYGAPPHVGRGGWTWYTGSSGWMYRVAIETLLGFRLMGGNAVAIEPCIPADWPGYTIHYRVPGTEAHYEIRVERRRSEVSGRRDGVARVVAADVDGASCEIRDGAAWIPLRKDPGHHKVRVFLADQASA